MRRFFFSLAMLALATQLHAQQFALDDVMPKDVQQKAGISKLSPKEKIELENWLNSTFVLKVKKPPQAEQLFLSINIENGKKLRLSDNSVWEISPDDVALASAWITPSPVTIEPSGNIDYPCLIINAHSGMGVKARKIG